MAKDKVEQERESATKPAEKKILSMANKEREEGGAATKIKDKKLATMADGGTDSDTTLGEKKLAAVAKSSAERGKDSAAMLKEKKSVAMATKTERESKAGTKTKEKGGPNTGRRKDSLVKQKEEMSKKNGLHHKIFSVDKYTVNEYIGEWLDDKKHGYGTQVWSKTGSMYVGYWKHGKPDGDGTQKVLDPKLKDYVVKYAGDWKNGKKHGMGLYFDDSGTVYEGQWVEGHQHGWGRMYFPNGDVYAGEWLKDRHQGQGIMYYANKNIYVGEWRDGMKNGQGSCYSHSKNLYFEGIWVDGSPTSLEQLSPSEFETRNQDIRSCIEVLKMWNPMV